MNFEIIMQVLILKAKIHYLLCLLPVFHFFPAIYCCTLLLLLNSVQLFCFYVFVAKIQLVVQEQLIFVYKSFKEHSSFEDKFYDKCSLDNLVYVKLLLLLAIANLRMKLHIQYFCQHFFSIIVTLLLRNSQQLPCHCFFD